MPPPERDLGRATVHLEHLPREARHHALKALVARIEARAGRAVEFVGLDDGVVGAHLQHVLSRLRRPAVDREGVGRPVDSAPVGQVRLVARLDLPVLDELLDKVREAARRVVRFLGWRGVSVMNGGEAGWEGNGGHSLSDQYLRVLL